MTRIALLIPAYNAASTIEETLQSIATQSMIGSVERIVIADDCSIDQTISIVRDFQSSVQLNIEIWESDKNGGERVVVNRSFARLFEEGIEWCFVLHADDVAKPHWLRTILDAMPHVSGKTASICSSWDDWYPDRTIPGEEFPERSPILVEGTVETAKSTLARGCWWHFSGCAMNLSQFHVVGGFCEDMPQLGDLEWLIRCALAKRDINYLPRTLIRYRQSSQNVSAVSYRTNRDLKECLLIAKRYIGNSDLRTAILEFRNRSLSRAIRRCGASLVRCNFSRFLSALKIAFAFTKHRIAER